MRNIVSAVILAAAVLSTGCASTAPTLTKEQSAKRFARVGSVCRPSSLHCDSYSPGGKPDSIVEHDLSEVRERVAASLAE